MYTGTEIWNKSIGTVPNIHTEDRIRQSTTGEYHIQSNELHPHLSLQPAFQLTARSDLKLFWPWRHAHASTAAHALLSGFNLVFDRVVFRTSTGICEKRTLSFPVMEPEVFDTCKSSNYYLFTPPLSRPRQVGWSPLVRRPAGDGAVAVFFKGFECIATLVVTFSTFFNFFDLSRL